MITALITITLTSLLGTLIGYVSFNAKLKDIKIKYKSLKDFADNAASKILQLEEDKKRLAAEVTRLVAMQLPYKTMPESPKASKKSQKAKKR
jgi:hypothetical protein